MEDLSRYRFQSDRPPSENNQLMSWSHRGILQTLKMQADIHQIIVGTVFPAFSSRFDAQTGAPGVRCRPVTKQDIEKAARGEGWLAPELERLNWTLEKMRPNDLVPTGDGEILVSPAKWDRAKGVKVVHADLNAAQNLQRRFWGGDEASTFRVSCDVVDMDGKRYAVPKTDSFFKVFGIGVFESTDEEGVYRWVPGRKIEKKGLRRGKLSGEDADENEWLEEARELQGKAVTLFRDPSGQIYGGRWLTAKLFWGWVERLVAARLRDRSWEPEAAVSERGK